MDDVDVDPGEHLDDGEADIEAPVRLRKKKYSRARRFRAIKDLESALNPDNYNLVPPTRKDIRYNVKVTADRKRGRDAKDITWSTQSSASGRRGPENIMRKPQELSAEAKAAKTNDQFWSLFITGQILEVVEKWTNQKIAEDLEEKQYSVEKLRKCPYLKQTDKVNLCLSNLFLSCLFLDIKKVFSTT